MQQNRSGIRWTLILAFGLYALGPIGCGQLKKRSEVGAPSQPPTSVESPGQIVDPVEPIAVTAPKRVALILGGGGARSLAHAGVIRAFTKEKIEISHVAAVEWAALAAAGYATSGQSHDMDWKLYKIDGLGLKFGSSGFFGIGGKRSIQDLSEYFTTNFGKSSVESAKVNFSCASQTLGAAGARVVQRGPMDQALKACIPYPPFFEVGKTVAAPNAIWNLVKSMKKDDADIVVFINVLTPNILADPLIRKDSLTTLLWTQTLESHLQARDLIKNSYSIPLDKFSIFDFSNRKNIEDIGEKTGQEIVRSLKERYAL